MAQSPITNLPLGRILQIAYSKGIRVQISQDYRDYEMVKRAKVEGHAPRSIDFYFQQGLLPANTQWRRPGQQNRAFPRAFQPSTAEYSATLKEVQSSIELEMNLWERAKVSPKKYAEPLQMILNSNMVSTKREMARALWQDGTGVIAQLGASAAALSSPTSNVIRFTLDQSDTSRGHVGYCEYQDILALRTSAGVATAFDSSLATEPVYWKVVGKSRENGYVDMQGLDANFEPVASITSITTQAESGSVFYKYDQPTFPDLTAITSSTEYNDLTETLVGLETLAANDNRKIHGIQMTGINGASEVDCANNPLDLLYFNKLMDQAKIEVGAEQYRWKQAVCAPEAHSRLIESRETDRRFMSWQDAVRGTEVFGIKHRMDKIELVDSEYVHPKRLYCLPEAKNGEKVIEFHGTDFKSVAAKEGDEFLVKVYNGQYVDSMVSYMQAACVLIAKHPKAIARLRNFS